LARKLTFGNVSKMLDMLPVALQTKISKNYTNLSSTPQLTAIISLLVLFRNTCAHNDRLYNYRANRAELPTMPLHKKLGIPRFPNGVYQYGIQDLFALVIALRYLLEEKNFNAFFNSLQELLNHHPDNSVFTKNELLKDMGFPPNWQDVMTLAVCV
jgi:abortive infection bacteriophage resistance protein